MKKVKAVKNLSSFSIVPFVSPTNTIETFNRHRLRGTWKVVTIAVT